jgi:glycosyltransferase involved in cell wall biosynthesis
MQRGIAQEDYEVILVDNGSKDPLNAANLRKLLPGLVVHRIEKPQPSPCKAINLGIRMAQGDLVSVMIDGARMASPGLLAAALTATRLSPRAAVGTVAFHLGPAVQMESILNGYGPKAEDKLLASVEWERNGYRLFDISVFAGSSSQGWFVLPNETNALFMSPDLWREIGGYDERFESPGGGLVNLDVWKRVCEDPTVQVVMLLGEATFHQVHGGIATNNPKHGEAVAGFGQEYKAIRGHDFTPPAIEPAFYGRIPAEALPSLAKSVGAELVDSRKPENSGTARGIARFLKRKAGL